MLGYRSLCSLSENVTGNETIKNSRLYYLNCNISKSMKVLLHPVTLCA